MKRPQALITEARTLLFSGYHVAAACLARAALERHLNTMCDAVVKDPQHAKNLRRGPYGRRICWLAKFGFVFATSKCDLRRAYKSGTMACHGYPVNAERAADAVDTVAALIAGMCQPTTVKNCTLQPANK